MDAFLYNLKDWFGFATIDRAVSGLQKATVQLELTQRSFETKAAIQQDAMDAAQVKRNEMTEQAARATRILSKINHILS